MAQHSINGGDLDLNLETLKDEILHYLESSDFGVFRSHPGGLEGLSMINWESERFPDYRMFLDAAAKSGAKLICFATRELAGEEIDEAADDIETMELEREERRDYDTRIRAARHHVGSTCSIELAFALGSHLYVYELRPDWYEDFLEVVDELSTMFPVTEESGPENDSLGGFYSNN